MVTNKIKSFLLPIALVLLSLLFTWPYFKPGLPKTDDSVSMVLRSSGFHQSFLDGHIPVRWIQRLNENYGYPVTNFLYPLPFYLAEPLNILGFSSLQSIKIIFVLSTVISTLTMYWWTKSKTKTRPAFLAALVYTYSSYRFIDLFQRGSIGESVAFSILPLIFLFIDKYTQSKKFTQLTLSSICFGLLITAHNTLALIFSPIIALYFIIQLKPLKSSINQKLIYFSTWLTLSISLSAFFWLPALFDLQYTRSSLIQIAQVEDFFASPIQLLNQIGLLSLVIIAISLVKVKSLTSRFFVIVSIVSILIQVSIFSPIWHILPLEKLVQFPIRFNAVLVFATAYLTGQITSLKKNRYHLFLTSIAIIAIVLSSYFSLYNTFKVQSDQFPQGYFEANFDTSTNQKEFTPKYVKTDPTTFAPTPFTIDDPLQTHQIITTNISTQEKYLQIKLINDIDITFNTHYFPGWKLYIDGNPTTNYQTTQAGTIKLNLPSSKRQDKLTEVKLVWEETPLRNFANYLSLTAALLLFFYLTYTYTHKNYSKTAAIISLAIIAFSVFTQILSKRQEFTQTFDPQIMEQKYLNSQWVNPKSSQPLGDHGLYAWAGWAYIHGENPILINSEMPPLGKYFIGLGLLLIKHPAYIGLFFASTLLISLYLLSRQVIQDSYLALIPPALFSTETIYKGLLSITMLDAIQITFLNLAFLFLLKSTTNKKHFILASLMLGGVLSTKFYATGFLVISSIVIFYLISKQFNLLKYFLLSLPLAFLVHLLSYFQFFLKGGTLRQYLGTQKYILNFYQNSSTSVPFGSYWKLVFFNRWRVWWGPKWGEYYTLTTREWQPTWIINAFAAFFGFYLFIKNSLNHWIKNKKLNLAQHHILTSWLLVYAAFLTFIGGWPHYMLLFLPYSNILLVKLTIDHSSSIKKILKIK